jgi:hypothetical protein
MPAKLQKSKNFQRHLDKMQHCVTKSSGTYAIVVGQRDKAANANLIAS